MIRYARTAAVVCFLGLCLWASRDAGALTDEQCLYFQVEGRTAVCHATGSPNRPYVLINASTQACFAFATHPADFVLVGGSCALAAPLPEGAPCDATLTCADGLACQAGVCQVTAASRGFSDDLQRPARADRLACSVPTKR